MDSEQLIDELINIAISEDIGDGDHTSVSCLNKDTIGEAKLLIKDKGILAGIEIARKIFHIIDESLEIDIKINDGTWVSEGDIAFYIKGKQISILSAERLVLNFMQRMSGIATQTNIYAKKLKDFKTKILDTRKTTPGLRLIEKMAVKIDDTKCTGCGVCINYCNFDAIELKDHSAMIKEENCVECNACVYVCPKQAINILSYLGS